MAEMRKNKRIKCQLKTVVRKILADGKTLIFEFLSNNLSLGGIFICTEDLSLFDLGEEINVLIEDNSDRFYQGKARVVRSARLFTEEKILAESGFGLMFIDPLPDFISMLNRKIDRKSSIIL